MDYLLFIIQFYNLINRINIIRGINFDFNLLYKDSDSKSFSIVLK